MNRLALFGIGLLLAGSLAYSLAAQTPGADDDLDVTVPSPGAQAAAAGELAARRAYVRQLEPLVAKLQTLHDDGRKGGEAEKLLAATTALEIARAELAAAQSKPREMAAHYANAAQSADRTVEAVQAAYDAGAAPLSDLLSALKTQAQVHVTLASLRR
jgi:hypothetical protein